MKKLKSILLNWFYGWRFRWWCKFTVTLMAMGFIIGFFWNKLCNDTQCTDINSGRNVEEFPENKPAIDPDTLFLKSGVPTLLVGRDKIEIRHEVKRLILDFSSGEMKTSGNLKYDEAAKTFIDALSYYGFGKCQHKTRNVEEFLE